MYLSDHQGFRISSTCRLMVLHRLVERGNTVLVIEHNVDVIKTADWIIDLGPEGGRKGGEIVAEGPPEVVAANPRSFTGHFLAPLLHVTPEQVPAPLPTSRPRGRKARTAK